MKPMNFKAITRFFSLIFVLCFQFNLLFAGDKEEQQFYELKVYHYNSEAQLKLLENFLEKAYVPALHRAGIKTVGVFYPAAGVNKEGVNDSVMYLLIPFSSLEQLVKIEEDLLLGQVVY